MWRFESVKSPKQTQNNGPVFKKQDMTQILHTNLFLIYFTQRAALKTL